MRTRFLALHPNLTGRSHVLHPQMMLYNLQLQIVTSVKGVVSPLILRYHPHRHLCKLNHTLMSHPISETRLGFIRHQMQSVLLPTHPTSSLDQEGLQTMVRKTSLDWFSHHLRHHIAPLVLHGQQGQHHHPKGRQALLRIMVMEGRAKGLVVLAMLRKVLGSLVLTWPMMFGHSSRPPKMAVDASFASAYYDSYPLLI